VPQHDGPCGFAWRASQRERHPRRRPVATLPHPITRDLSPGEARSANVSVVSNPRKRRIPVDLIVHTPKKVRERLDMGDIREREVLENGSVAVIAGCIRLQR